MSISDIDIGVDILTYHTYISLVWLHSLSQPPIRTVCLFKQRSSGSEIRISQLCWPAPTRLWDSILIAVSIIIRVIDLDLPITNTYHPNIRTYIHTSRHPFTHTYIYTSILPCIPNIHLPNPRDAGTTWPSIHPYVLFVLCSNSGPLNLRSEINQLNQFRPCNHEPPTTNHQQPPPPHYSVAMMISDIDIGVNVNIN